MGQQAQTAGEWIGSDFGGRRFGVRKEIGIMRTNGQRAGFSLVELLIVILIIALIVAILLPALAGARNASKRTDTESLCAQLSSAIGQFQIDNRRLPGQFSVREMASQENQDVRGMSMAENVMLELGGVKRTTTPPVPATGWVANVGPSATGTIWVKPGETEGKAYFTPSAKYYVAMNGTTQVGSMAGANLPDLVDGFGNPLLLWIEDEASVGKPELISSTGPETRVAFVRSTFEPGANSGPAKFYTATNACFLKSTALARGGMDITSTDQEKGSFFGGATEVNRLNALAAILGNPNFPKFPNDDPNNAQAAQIVPTAARGSFAIQSAGIDGTYLGRLAKKNRGANTAIGGVLYFGSAIKNASGADHVDPDGKPFVYDFAKEFDDVIVSGN